MDKVSTLQTLDSIEIICLEQTCRRNYTLLNDTQHSKKRQHLAKQHLMLSVVLLIAVAPTLQLIFPKPQ
jgi:hypothetical protein